MRISGLQKYLTTRKLNWHCCLLRKSIPCFWDFASLFTGALTGFLRFLEWRSKILIVWFSNKFEWLPQNKNVVKISNCFFFSGEQLLMCNFGWFWGQMKLPVEFCFQPNFENQNILGQKKTSQSHLHMNWNSSWFESHRRSCAWWKREVETSFLEQRGWDVVMLGGRVGEDPRSGSERVPACSLFIETTFLPANEKYNVF